MALSALSSPEWSRLLRKQHAEAAVKLLKGLFIVLCLSLLSFALSDYIRGRLRVSATQSKLKGEISQPLSAPLPTADKTKNNDYAVIAQKNFFGPLGPPAAPTPMPKAVSKVPLTLIGTFVSKKEPPSAIIEDPRKQAQDVFLVNESIFGEAKLVAVYPDRVEIDRAGTIEILKLDDSTRASSASSGGSAPPGAGEEVVVDEAEVDTALSNLPLLLTQVRAVPYFKDGQAVGLRLFAIRSGSLFEKVGLKNGDILKSINGNSLGDFTQAIKLFEKLKAERSINLSLERNREEKEYRYTIR